MKQAVFLKAMLVVALAATCGVLTGAQAQARDVPSDLVRLLAEEVSAKGWIVYSARSAQGDWDLFACRPDGSPRRNLTRSPRFNEFAPQLSRDSRRMLYRRLPRGERIDGNQYGTQGELVVARNDGSEPRVLGSDARLAWASWSPDGRKIACLAIKGVFFFDLATMKESRRLDRQGFFQQLAWSPDGRWLLGVANSFGTGWSVARMNISTGHVQAVNTVDCCTPDWFPGSDQVVFSWRPPGQTGNHGQGWTQLWMADAEGKNRQLVYGEDDRHVYGGHVSPDGQYVLFTGNVREDGDPENAGAAMGLMRLSDAPIIGGESPELRTRHPRGKDGPVLTLPVGWEPCWTFAEIFSSNETERSAADNSTSSLSRPPASDAAQLATELRLKGWLVFSAKMSRGDWDLFIMRPDGSQRRRIVETNQFNEGGARFSPDGRRLLYFRMPKDVPVDNNTYGMQQLVIANADGSHPIVLGQDFPWATWSPDGKQLARLRPRGIEIVDWQTRAVVRRLPRQGLVQQLIWSPDGELFTGTANGLGPYWNIGCLNMATGRMQALSETDRYNCTPDWTPDSQHVLYARGIIPEQGGKAELWMASIGGEKPRLLYAESGRHVYGACASPDGKYLLFTRSVEDLGKVDNSQTTMSIVRWSDTPMIGDDAPDLRRPMPAATRGPRLDLGFGWEPHWTSAEIPVPPTKENGKAED